MTLRLLGKPRREQRLNEFAHISRLALRDLSFSPAASKDFVDIGVGILLDVDSDVPEFFVAALTGLRSSDRAWLLDRLTDLDRRRSFRWRHFPCLHAPLYLRWFGIQFFRQAQRAQT